MKHAYGDWTNYDAIVQNGGFTLQQALQCGGSHVRKSQMVMKILHQVKAAHGTYSLNHLLHVEDDDATKELLSYNGVGPKTASCILALTLHRSRFVVDTHIHRITGILGWRPKEATQNKLALILNMKFPISTSRPSTCSLLRMVGNVYSVAQVGEWSMIASFNGPSETISRHSMSAKGARM